MAYWFRAVALHFAIFTDFRFPYHRLLFLHYIHVNYPTRDEWLTAASPSSPTTLAS